MNDKTQLTERTKKKAVAVVKTMTRALLYGAIGVTIVGVFQGNTDKVTHGLLLVVAAQAALLHLRESAQIISMTILCDIYHRVAVEGLGAEATARRRDELIEQFSKIRPNVEV